MQRSLVRELLWLVAGAGVLIAFFSLVDIFPDKEKFQLSLQQEERLGGLIMQSFLATSDEFHDPVVDTALDIIQDRLILLLEDSPYEYKIVLVQDQMVNAFATVGGHIVLFTGLLKFAESPEELAAVMAHEIGHVELKHVGDRLVKELGIGLVLAILGGDQAMITEITRSLISAAYSRRHEAEADAFGHRLLERAGISTEAYISFFHRMDENVEISEKMEFIMSHPHHKSRIREAEAYDVAADFVEISFEMDWGGVQRVVSSE